GNNVFVTKLTSDGSALVYSAVFGRGMSEGFGIAVDASGNAYVTGTTQAANFTTTANAVQATRPNSVGTDIDAFFVKLNASGSALLYSTYLGSDNPDYGEGIAVDASGNAYVAGTTTGRAAIWRGNLPATIPFPTTPAYMFTGGAAGFIAKFDPTAATGTASLIYSTLIGGDDEVDQAHSIAIDASGNAYVTGSGGLNFPLTAGAYGTSIVKPGAFVTKFNANGTASRFRKQRFHRRRRHVEPRFRAAHQPHRGSHRPIALPHEVELRRFEC
ncbi:MAG: hypothetical protein DMF59_10315, partial [Acidobacteria bacterium]